MLFSCVQEHLANFFLWSAFRTSNTVGPSCTKGTSLFSMSRLCFLTNGICSDFGEARLGSVNLHGDVWTNSELLSHSSGGVVRGVSGTMVLSVELVAVNLNYKRGICVHVDI